MGILTQDLKEEERGGVTHLLRDTILDVGGSQEKKAIASEEKVMWRRAEDHGQRNAGKGEK